LTSMPVLRHLTLVAAAGSVTAGAMMAMISPVVLSHGHLSTSDAGTVVAFGNIGGLIGAAGMPVVARRIGAGRLAVLAVASVAILGVIVPDASRLAELCLAYGLWQLAYVLLVTNGIAVRLLVTPPEIVSSVAMTARMVAWGCQPIGGYAAAGLAALAGPRTAVQVMTVFAGLAALTALAFRTGGVVRQALSETDPQSSQATVTR
jgi:hypothetical protein